jgi:Protein of unknown function (DUF3455)
MSCRFAMPFLLLFMVACGSMQTPTSVVDVPAKLRPSAGESLALIVPAKGVQIYECRAKKEQAEQYEWAFVAPEADLFDVRGAKIGKHYAGPNWESIDGSKISGALKERADAPRSGSFSKITSIQRVNTVGGVAPKQGCSQSNVGTIGRVNYTADYYFYTAK